MLIIVVFFSYGHVENLLQNTHDFNPASLAKALFGIYCFVFVAGLVLIFRFRTIPRNIVLFVEIAAALLILINLTHILLFEIQTIRIKLTTQNVSLPKLETSVRRDIYYIVLDAYAREDVLREYYSFDNAYFLNELRSRGFMIPDCAYSNYDATVDTISSVLNMEYLENLGQSTTAIRRISPQKIDLIHTSLIRQVFSEYGYQFVTTRGYETFNDITDAEIYLNYYKSRGLQDRLSERTFTSLFLNTTMLRLLNGGINTSKTNSSSDNAPISDFSSPVMDKNSTSYIEADFWYHQSNYVFDSLSHLPQEPGPFLVYAHINSPHGPYVFNPDGSFHYPQGSTEEKMLYTNTLLYLNERLIKLIDNLIEKSEIAPIIILQADHGTHAFDYGLEKHKILSAYYLPGNVSIEPYQTLTPINNFRLVLHNYFNPAIELLPDFLWVRLKDKYVPVQAACGLSSLSTN